MEILAFSLIALCGLLTLLLGLTVFHLHSSDAAGNGLALVYAVFQLGLLWALLGFLLLISGVRGAFPGGEGAGVLIVYFTLIAAQCLAIQLASTRRTLPLAAVAVQAEMILAPLCIVIHASWFWWTATHAGAGPNRWASLAALCGLAAVPFVAWLAPERARTATPAAQ